MSKDPFAGYMIFALARPWQILKAYLIAATTPFRLPKDSPRRVVLAWSHALGEILKEENRARMEAHRAECTADICPFCIEEAGIYTVEEVEAMSPNRREWTSGGRDYI